jgi:hypothetical protein
MSPWDGVGLFDEHRVTEADHDLWAPKTYATSRYS